MAASKPFPATGLVFELESGMFFTGSHFTAFECYGGLSGWSLAGRSRPLGVDFLKVMSAFASSLCSLLPGGHDGGPRSFCCHELGCAFPARTD